MSQPISLTRRVVLFVALAITMSLLLNAVLVITSIKHHFMAQDADELREITRAINQVLRSADSTQLTTQLTHAVAGHHGVYYQVNDSSGKIIYPAQIPGFTQGTQHFAPVSNITAETISTWQANKKHYRGVITTFANDRQTFRVIAAIDMEFHLQFLQKFKGSLWFIILATGAVTLLAAWFGIHQGHLPLRVLSRKIRMIQMNRLDTRIDPHQVPFELKELVGSFNHMMIQLEKGFARLAHYSADIAHELRTPLTNLITQTQVTLSRTRTLTEYEELLYSNLEEHERLAKMVSDMLWLAQCDADMLQPQLTSLNLKAEVTELFDFFGALADEYQITFKMTGPEVRVGGDRALIRRAISNVLSNALRHTASGQWIEVKLTPAQDGLVGLTVINPGEEIPAAHIPQLFDRFYRVDPSRQRNTTKTEGAGLGLAICRSIIEAHKGSIQVDSHQGITKFQVVLPVDSITS